MRVYPLLALAVIGTSVVLGSSIVLDRFNRAVLPPQPFRAVAVERISDELVRCNVLGTSLTLSVPGTASDLWMELDDTP